MNKKVVSAIAALALVATFNVSVLAEPLSERIKVQQQKSTRKYKIVKRCTKEERRHRSKYRKNGQPDRRSYEANK